MRQLRLASSGCQVYPLHAKHCVCLNDDYVVFASTLAVYVHSAKTHRLEKLLSDHSNTKTLTSMCFSFFNNDLLAVANCDGRITLWSIREEAIKCKVSYKPGVHITTMAWSRTLTNACVMVTCEQGVIKVLQWDVSQSDQVAELVSIKVKEDVKVSALDWSISGLTCAVGCNNGIVFLYKPADKTQRLLLVKDRVAPVSDLQWDKLSVSYLLVAYSAFISLWDAETGAEVHVFDKQQGGGITSVAWLDWQPGSFCSSNAKSGVLKLWNVSQKVALSAIKISAEGLLVAKVDVATKSVACACTSGSVYVYSLKNMQEEFCSNPGHTETIFDCKFNPSTADIFASASYDGTVKLWSLSDMSLVSTLHGACDIIYACEWSPNGKFLLGGCSSGKIMIWNSETGLLLGYFLHHSKACYCVNWNKSHTNLIASTSGDGKCIVFEIDVDAISEKVVVATGSKSRRLPGNAYLTLDQTKVSDKPLNSNICMRYSGKCPMYGVSWNPTVFNILCSGSHDGAIRVFDYTRQEPLVRVLMGHSARAFHCVWSPLIPGILASGGDDRKVLLWNIDLDELLADELVATASKTILPTRELFGHTSNVRAISWNYEHKELLLSGSWDSSIRLWHHATGECLRVVTDHVADVYSITSHPDRPFIYVSCSRDSTIRQFELEGVFSLLRARAVFDQSFDRIVNGDIRSGDGILAPLLCGRKSRSLSTALRTTKTSDPIELAIKYYQMYNFFSGSNACECWENALIILYDKANRDLDRGIFLRPLKFRLIQPERDVLASAISAARRLESRKMASTTTRSQRLEDDLRSAALAFAKAGDMFKYCSLLVEINDWTKALAVAPSVSLDYWRDLTRQYAEHLFEQGNEDCVPHFLAVHDEARAVQFYLSRKNVKSAFVVAAAKNAKREGNKRATGSDSSFGLSSTSAEESKGGEGTALMRTVVDATALTYMNSDFPTLAAAQYLACGRTEEAVQVLQASGEFDTAYALSICFGLQRSADALLVHLAENVASNGESGKALALEMLGKGKTDGPKERETPEDALSELVSRY